MKIALAISLIPFLVSFISIFVLGFDSVGLGELNTYLIASMGDLDSDGGEGAYTMMDGSRIRCNICTESRRAARLLEDGSDNGSEDGQDDVRFASKYSYRRHMDTYHPDVECDLFIRCAGCQLRCVGNNGVIVHHRKSPGSSLQC